MERFSIDRFLFSPGRRLVGFVVRGVSKRGILASVVNLFSDRGIDIAYCSRPRWRGRGTNTSLRRSNRFSRKSPFDSG